MANINRVTITGNLTRDPELVEFANGGAVCKLGVAVNGGYRDRESGDFVEQTHFVDVEVYSGTTGGQARACATHLSKGRPVAIDGRLDYQQWETPEGNRSRLKVRATVVQFIGAPSNGESTPAPAAAAMPANETPAPDDDIPF